MENHRKMESKTIIAVIKLVIRLEEERVAWLQRSPRQHDVLHCFTFFRIWYGMLSLMSSQVKSLQREVGKHWNTWISSVSANSVG